MLRVRCWRETVAFAGLAVVAFLAAPRATAEGPPEKAYPHGDWTGDCATCHREERWTPVVVDPKFRHAPSFPLEGAHRAAGCRQCHVSLEFRKVGRTCAGCHEDVHRGEFGTDCARCHTTRNFLERAAAIRSHRASRFPLTGAHAVADCDACHRMRSGGQWMFVGLRTDCSACHANASFGAGAPQRPPDHVANGFVADCIACHDTVSFGNPNFNHAGTGFALTGAHAGLPCSRCHGTPFQQLHDPSCWACHANDYNNTTDPYHAAAGFSHECTQCHTTASWGGARFTQHDASSFPIYSGTHNGRWSHCSDCHTVPANYASFSCISGGCHPQADTDAKHTGVAGYLYDSSACYGCHPTGQAGGRFRR